MILRLTCVFVLISGTNLYALTTSALFLQGLPAAYVPGATFTAEVGLPPIINLGAYNVDIILTSDTGQAGTDFFFDLGATVPAPAGYVFPTTANFLGAVNIDSPLQHRITLSDFDFDGVNVEASINDLLAVFAIGTSNDFQGDLTIAFSTDGLLLDTPSVTPTPVAEFPNIVSATMSAPPATVFRIPEISTIALVLVGSALLYAYRIRVGHVTSDAN
ncbi:MAG: hypothetical protein AAGD11_16105 [Planctomycetota bacterium]